MQNQNRQQDVMEERSIIESYIMEFWHGFETYMKGVGIDVEVVESWWPQREYRFKWNGRDVEIHGCYCDERTFRLYAGYDNSVFDDRYAIDVKAKICEKYKCPKTT